MKNLKILPVTIFVIFFGFATHGAQVPTVELNNCNIPAKISSKLLQGIKGAIEKNAGFFIDPEDIGHAHLLISKEGYAKLAQEKYTAEELMDKTEALLIHSQEFTSMPNLYPAEVRKKRNIYLDMNSGEVEILDTDKYQVNSLYTIFAVKDLGMIETFQVNFDKLPSSADMPCQLSQMIILTPNVFTTDIQQIVVSGILFTGAENDRFKFNNLKVNCFCSGKVEALGPK